MARLVFPTEAGKWAVELDSVSTIGQDRFSTIHVLDRRVSLQHCVLLQRGDRFLLRNSGSSHGLSVNGEPVKTERTLNDGDEITLGAIQGRFEAFSMDPPGKAQPVVLRPAKVSRSIFPELTLAELHELANKTNPTEADRRTAVDESRRLATQDYATFKLRTRDGKNWVLERLAEAKPDATITLADIDQAISDVAHGYFTPPLRPQDIRGPVPSGEGTYARSELARQLHAEAFPLHDDGKDPIAELKIVLAHTERAEREGREAQIEALQELRRLSTFSGVTPSDVLRTILRGLSDIDRPSEAPPRAGGHVHHFRSVTEITDFCRATYGANAEVHRTEDGSVTVVFRRGWWHRNLVSPVRYIEHSGTYLVWLPDPAGS